MIEKYRKRPVEVEAVEWDGNNYDEIKRFLGKCLVGEIMIGDDIMELMIDNDDFNGSSYARIGDMIVKDEYGDFIVMNSDWFKKNYDKCYTVDEYYALKEK